jgi:hypothetical protein
MANTAYDVNIYLIEDANGTDFRVHLSNSALYLTPGDAPKVTFNFLGDSNYTWTIAFVGNSPFSLTDGGANTVTTITDTTPVYLSYDAKNLTYAQDYNYTVSVSDDSGVVATEDPQVIIGGKGSGTGPMGNGGLLRGVGSVAIAAGAAGLVLGILAYHMIAGRD